MFINLYLQQFQVKFPDLYRALKRLLKGLVAYLIPLVISWVFGFLKSDPYFATIFTGTLGAVLLGIEKYLQKYTVITQ